jgi:transposase
MSRKRKEKNVKSVDLSDASQLQPTKDPPENDYSGADPENDCSAAEPGSTTVLGIGSDFDASVEHLPLDMSKVSFPASVLAGADVHSAQITITILTTSNQGDTTNETRQFTTFKSGIRKAAEWLKENKVQGIIMESTGKYWKSPYDLLRNQGIRCVLANARHVKNVPGRKTDTSDSLWLAFLLRAGLVRENFVPSKKIQNLRVLSRFRLSVVDSIVSIKNEIHGLLTECGYRLSLVMTDVSGATGRLVVNCIINGLKPESILAQVKSKIGYRLKASTEDFLEALQGDLSKETLFVLNSLKNSLLAQEALLDSTEQELFVELADYMPMIRLLETIPGVSKVAAATLIVETGGDMSQFKSAEALSSWGGMCPGNNESAGKRKSSRTLKGNRYLRRILCETAQAAAKTDCYFRQKYKNISLRRGKKRAIIAIGHKMLIVIYHMLTKMEPYKDKTVNYEELVLKKNAARWIKKLAEYGYITPPDQAREVA